LIVIDAFYGFELDQMDLVTAFLNSFVTDKIYIERGVSVTEEF